MAGLAESAVEEAALTWLGDLAIAFSMAPTLPPAALPPRGATRYEVCCDLFHGFDYKVYFRATPTERLTILPAAQEHILVQENGKDRLFQAVVDLSKAFALAVPRDEALAIRDEVAFFQVVKAALAKTTTTRQRPEEELNHAIAQIVSRAIAPEGIVNLFEVAGLKKPDISLLSDEFLAEVRGMPQKNLAVELLRKLLNDEIKTRGRKNLVQARPSPRCWSRPSGDTTTGLSKPCKSSRS